MDIEAKFLAAVVLMLQAMCITGCSRPESVHTEQDCAQEKSKFILECAVAANPKSDEEGEDLVAQCEQTAERLFKSLATCPARFVCVTPKFDYSERVLCDNAPFNSDCEATCKKHGWMRK